MLSARLWSPAPWLKHTGASLVIHILLGRPRYGIQVGGLAHCGLSATAAHSLVDESSRRRVVALARAYDASRYDIF